MRQRYLWGRKFPHQKIYIHLKLHFNGSSFVMKYFVPKYDAHQPYSLHRMTKWQSVSLFHKILWSTRGNMRPMAILLKIITCVGKIIANKFSLIQFPKIADSFQNFGLYHLVGLFIVNNKTKVYSKFQPKLSV